MKKVFLDTNVVLDFILKREGFAKDTALIFDLGERKKLELCISSLSVNNIDYVVSKIESAKKSKEIILRLLSLVDILSVGKSTVEKAVMSEFKDFEDALQNFCAAEADIPLIVTRNLKDYKKSSLSILSPKEFLIAYELDEQTTSPPGE